MKAFLGTLALSVLHVLLVKPATERVQFEELSDSIDVDVDDLESGSDDLESSYDDEASGYRDAVVTYVGAADEGHMWGVYSIRRRLSELNATRVSSQIALIPEELPRKRRTVLETWLGRRNVVRLNSTPSADGAASWRNDQIQAFHKLQIFNMTDYDRIVFLGSDVLLRTNLMHWFEYPMPCATQRPEDIAWDTGAMVIRPDAAAYRRMEELMPSYFESEGGKQRADDHFDRFLSRCLTSENATMRMNTMKGASMVPSRLLMQENLMYWLRFRRDIIETVQFTHKPWLKGTVATDEPTCQFLREWKESVKGAEEYLKPLENDFLRDCPPLKT